MMKDQQETTMTLISTCRVCLIRTVSAVTARGQGFGDQGGDNPYADNSYWYWFSAGVPAVGS